MSKSLKKLVEESREKNQPEVDMSDRGISSMLDVNGLCKFSGQLLSLLCDWSLGKATIPPLLVNVTCQNLGSESLQTTVLLGLVNLMRTSLEVLLQFLISC